MQKGPGILLKTLLIVKAAIFIICITFLQASAAISYAQKITVKEKEASLEKVFDDINKQTGYIFFYEDNVLSGMPKISFDVKNTPIKDVLDICFKDQPLIYTIAGKTIGVKKRQIQPVTAMLSPFLNTYFKNPVTVSGLIIDSATNTAIGNGVIHVALKKAIGTEKLTDLIIEKDGKFSFSYSSESPVVLNVFCLGYKAKILTIDAQKDTLLKIILSPAVNNLNEVKVTANSQLRLIPGGLSIEPDVKNFSAATFISTYLNFIPGLTMSQTGTISFLNRPLDVYVDGRKVALSGLDLIAYLQQYNIKDLTKIDILTEPGAGFDASTKAVINLSIKKFSNAGVQDIPASGYTTHDMYYFSNAFIYATPKLRLSNNVTVNHSNFYDNSFSSTTSASQPSLNSAQTINYSPNPQDNFNARIGLDAQISPKAQIGFSLLTSSVWKNTPYLYEIENAGVTTVIPSTVNNKSRRYNESAYFKLDMKKGTFQVDFSNIYLRYDNVVTNVLSSGTSVNNSTSINKNYYINSKQTWAFNKQYNLEGGFKYSYNDLSNTFQNVFNTSNNQTLTTYNEGIFAGYIQGAYTSKSFGLQLGLRAENTNLHLNNITTTIFHRDANYLNWFPNIVASFPKVWGLSANISYSSRISRPSYYQYLPYPDNFNANSINYSVGNSNLLTSITNSIGINLQKQFKNKSSITLMASKSYINSPDLSAPFIVNNSVVNIGLNGNQAQSYNVQLMFTQPLGFATLNLTPSFSRFAVDKSVLVYNNQTQYAGLNGTNNYSLSGSLNFKSYKGYNAIMSMGYSGRQYNLFGYNDPIGYSRLLINKSYLKDRLSTTFEIDDPFYWEKFSSHKYVNGLDIYSSNRPQNRMVYIAVSYRIGGLKPTIKRYDYQGDSRLKSDDAR